MTNQEIVKKLWDLCNVLRDDGITYHQYVTELTYILFLKMAQETGIEKDFPKLPFEKIKEVDGKETIVIIEKPYSWDLISSKNGIYLKNLYSKKKFIFESVEYFWRKWHGQYQRNLSRRNYKH